MENNQHTNNFDAMLKQSLEGTQMPVPTGVWEAVGSSIGTKAIVAAKVVSFKLLILKTVAGVVLIGGTAFGVYELLKTETTNNLKINKSLTNKPTEQTGITIDTDFNTEVITPKDIRISTNSFINEDSMISHPRSEAAVSNNEKVIDSETQDIESKETNIIEPAKKIEISKPVESGAKSGSPVIEPSKEPIKTTDKFSVNDIVMPNAFTPYDQDGFNDCFKIIIENETKFILQIYDDKGQRVFESMDKNKCWDGRNMNTGQMCKEGIYNYKLMYELRNGFKKTELRGLNLL